MSNDVIFNLIARIRDSPLAPSGNAASDSKYCPGGLELVTLDAIIFVRLVQPAELSTEENQTEELPIILP